MDRFFLERTRGKIRNRTIGTDIENSSRFLPSEIWLSLSLCSVLFFGVFSCGCDICQKFTSFTTFIYLLFIYCIYIEFVYDLLTLSLSVYLLTSSLFISVVLLYYYCTVYCLCLCLWCAVLLWCGCTHSCVPLGVLIAREVHVCMYVVL
jgi:hypothetical protein